VDACLCPIQKSFPDPVCDPVSVSATMFDLSRWPLFHRLPVAAIQAIQRCATERQFRAGELLLAAGARAEWLHVIADGLVREFYVTAAGDEHTRVFVSTGGVTGSLLDLTSGAPSVTWIQALEPTRTVAIRYADFNTLAAQHRELESLARALAQSLAIRKTKREYEMLALSAQERLAIWRAENPGLDGRITRRLLASYLGITPVHLSRISSKAAVERRREKARPQR
jgi:CRP-like cAMP-binding protein